MKKDNLQGFLQSFLSMKQITYRIKQCCFCLCCLSMFAYTQAIYEETQQDSKQQTTQSTQNSQGLQGAKNTDDSTQSVVHEFQEIIQPNRNPVFAHFKHELGLGYFTSIGASEIQNVNVNGALLNYSIPAIFRKTMLRFYLAMGFGNATIIAQNVADSGFYYSVLLGFEISEPMLEKDVIAYGVFGTEFGLSMIANYTTSISLNLYGGIDFVYKNFVFRPFIDANIYGGFGDGASGIGLYMDLGLKFFAYYKILQPFASLAIRRDFLQTNIGSFLFLPNNEAIYLGGNATAIDFKGGVKALASKHINFTGIIGAFYKLEYTNMNFYVALNMNFMF